MQVQIGALKTAILILQPKKTTDNALRCSFNTETNKFAIYLQKYTSKHYHLARTSLKAMSFPFTPFPSICHWKSNTLDFEHFAGDFLRLPSRD